MYGTACTTSTLGTPPGMTIARSPTATQVVVDAHETPFSAGPPDWKGEGGGGADHLARRPTARLGERLIPGPVTVIS